jgi:hypothetical protein
MTNRIKISILIKKKVKKPFIDWSKTANSKQNKAPDTSQ